MSEQSETGSRGRPRDPRVDEAILRAALELFTAHGPDATSIEKIAKRAGVARLTVYRRWSSKEELLIAALDQARGIDDTACYQQLLDTETELTEQELHAAVARLLESITEIVTRPELRGLIARLIGAASSHPELLRTFWDNYMHPRRQLANTAIRRAIELGGLPANIDPELLVDTVAGATLFTTLLHPDPPTEKELRERTQAIFRQLGIAVPDSNNPR